MENENEYGRNELIDGIKSKANETANSEFPSDEIVSKNLEMYLYSY